MSSINMQWLEEQTFFCLLETPPSFFCWASWASSSESDPSPSFAASVPASFFFSPSYQQNRNPVSNYSRAARVLTPVQHSCLQIPYYLELIRMVSAGYVDTSVAAGESLKVNLSKMSLKSARKASSSSAFSGTYSTSTSTCGEPKHQVAP